MAYNNPFSQTLSPLPEADTETFDVSVPSETFDVSVEFEALTVSDNPNEQAVFEFLTSQDSTRKLAGVPLCAAIVIFLADFWWCITDISTIRYVRWWFEGLDINVGFSRTKLEGYTPISVPEVMDLGWPRVFEPVKISRSIKLFNSMAFSVLRNRDVMSCFARWYCNLEPDARDFVRHCEPVLQALFAHIAWLEATCDERNLAQAEFDTVTKANGIHHAFPTYDDAMFVLISDSPACYARKYVENWFMSVPQQDYEVDGDETTRIIARDMQIDHQRFIMFANFLDEYTDEPFW